jgi:hypothetical protein
MKKIIFFTIFLFSIYSGYSQNATLGLFTERTVNNSFASNGLNTTNSSANQTFSDAGTDSGTNVIEVTSLSDGNTQAYFNYNPRLDLSSYTSYHISLKSTSVDATLIRLEDANNVQANLDPATYGFVNDGLWHSLTIPMSDISAASPTIDLSVIKNLFIVKTTSPRNDPFAFSDYIYYVDDVYLSGPPTLGLSTERTVTNSFTRNSFETTNASANESFSGTGTDSGTNVIEIISLSDGNTQAYFNYNPRLDMSPYTYYHISLKSTSTDATLIRLEDANNVQANLDPATYGFVNDGLWHSLKIPTSDITNDAPTLDLSVIKNLFIVKTTSPRNDPFVFASYIYYVDDVYLSGLVENQWTGDTNSDWSTASNWNQSLVPTKTQNVIIPDVTTAPVVAFDKAALAYNLTITEPDGISLTSGSALIVDGSSTGNITYNLSIADTNWHLVSSPVAGETYNDSWMSTNGIATGTIAANRGISTYDNDVDADGDWVYHQTGGSETTFSSGGGYSLLRSNSGNYGFTGTVKTEDISTTITQGASGTNKWNLIGNPFPSYIDIAAFLTANSTPLTDANEAVYIWNGTTYSEITTGYIHPGQAFFVNSNEASTSVAITKSMLSGQTGFSLLKNSDPSITLSVELDYNKKSTKINYLADKTTGLDPRFDVGVFTGSSNSAVNSLDIFTQLVDNNQGVNFARQSLPNTNYDNMIVPVGIKAAAGNEISFSVDAQNLPDGINVYLEDRLKNTFTRLDLSNSSYKVKLTEALNGAGRYYIHTSAKALSIDSENLNSISVYNINNSTLRIIGLQNGGSSLKIFTILGKEVLNQSFTSNGPKEILLPALAKGVYIVQIQNTAGKLNKKIILE